MNTSFYKFFLLTVLFSLILNFAWAQSFIMQSRPDDKTQFAIRFMRPAFARTNDLSSLSGFYDFSSNIPVSEKINILCSIPYGTMKFNDFEGENGLGNIYIGIQHPSGNKDENGSVLSAGIFLPSAKEEITIYGLFTNYYDAHKYWYDQLTIYGNYAYYNLSPQGVIFSYEIGPNLWIPTKNDGRDTELLIHYGFSVGYQGQSFKLSTELIGVAIITEDINNFDDRFIHSILFGGTYFVNNISPGIFYKLYLKDELSDIVDGVFGLKFDFTLD